MNVFEIIVVLFLYFLFKWGFRFVILVLIGKVVQQLKETGKEKLKEWEDNLKSE